jgi:predicted nicotinamide N-methyase
MVAGKRILELGSGTGLVGISTALNGANELVLTDLPELFDLLNFNVKRNLASSDCSIHVEEYDWYIHAIYSFISSDIWFISPGANRYLVR